MRIIKTELDGVVVIEPDVYRDFRGYFLETYRADKYADAGLPVGWVQDNQSMSAYGVLRGLHFQRLKPQGKLVRVLSGEIWDVAVDLRDGSPTWGRWVAETLSSETFRQLYIPPGFAHGFCVLSERALVEYKCTALYDPSDEVGIAYNDPIFAIPWPTADPILSPRDRAHPSARELFPTQAGRAPAVSQAQ
jgi:dTDP-4-dehydrorhamnose 3,5-epimerase